MRWTERVFGVLAGMLGLAALLVTVTQQAIIEHTGSVVLSIPTATTDRLAFTIPTGFAVLGSLLVTLGAVRDSRRGPARGLWMALVVIGAALCMLGVYLLSANNVWVNIGGTHHKSGGVASVSAAALFAPAALMGIVAAVVAGIGALPHGHAPALG